MSAIRIPAFAFIALASLLSACATPTVYAPAKDRNASGYTETRIEQNRFRITFQGGSGEPYARVKDLALLRAADLALTNGYDWFEVVNSYQETLDDRSPSVGVGVGAGNYGRNSGVDIGLGTSFPLSGPMRATTIEVVMGNGERPDRPNAYAAKSVKETIGATLPK